MNSAGTIACPNESTILIQRHVRGYLECKKYRNLHRATTRLQAGARAMAARILARIFRENKGVASRAEHTVLRIQEGSEAQSVASSPAKLLEIFDSRWFDGL